MLRSKRNKSSNARGRTDNTQVSVEEVEAAKVARAAFMAEINHPAADDDTNGGQRDTVIALVAVTVYLVSGILYYGARLGWTFGETCYFAFATITTVGYGDFNGSNDSWTMIFTCFFGFIGVAVVGIAVAQLLEAAQELQAALQAKQEEAMAQILEKSGIHASPQKASRTSRFFEWTKKNAWTRTFRVLFPVCTIGLCGSFFLLITEESDSAIMTTEAPFVTTLYVSIITGISIGYGDFSPSTPLGRLVYCNRNIARRRRGPSLTTTVMQCCAQC
jgi:hypothetical protein